MKSSPTPRTLEIESLESRCLLAGGLFNASPTARDAHSFADPGDHHPAEPPRHVSSPSHRAAAADTNRPDHDSRNPHQGNDPHRHRDRHDHDRHDHAAEQSGRQRHGPTSTTMPGAPMPEASTPESSMPEAPTQAAPTPTDAAPNSSSEQLSMPGTSSSGLSQPGGNASDSDLVQQTSDTAASDLITDPSRDAVVSIGDNAGGDDASLDIRSLPDSDEAANSHDSRDAQNTTPLIDAFSLRPRAPLPAPRGTPSAEWELDEDTLDRLKAVAESPAEPNEQDANVAWDAIVASWFDGPGGLIDLNAERQPLLHAEALDQIVAIELDAGLGLHRSLDLLAAAEPMPSEDERRVAILNAIAQAERRAVAPSGDQAAARTSALTYPTIVLIAGSLIAASRRQRAPKR